MKLITSAETCEFLSISRSHFYDICREDETFPAYKVGTEYRVDQEGLVSWLKDQKNKPERTKSRSTGRPPARKPVYEVRKTHQR